MSTSATGAQLAAARRRLSVWPPLPPGVWLRSPLPSLPFPFAEPGCRVLAWARQGLWHGVRALGLRGGDEVLMPAYHHGSEVEALVQAGLRPRFYDAPDGLEPDEATLDRMIGPNTRALHLTHFFGFPQDAARWRRFCDDRELLLLEDAAQAWLSSRDGTPVGSHGDLAVFCLYKAVGLPALLLLREPAPGAPLDRRPGIGLLARKHGAWLASRSAILARAHARLHPRRASAVPLDFGLRGRGDMPWSTTRFLLRRLSDGTVARRRRANYRALLDTLGDLVASPFERVPAGASPFLFPVETYYKATALERLRAQRVEALDVWSAGHPTMPSDGYPDAEARRARTVGLPVHQELMPRDIDQIATAVRRSITP